MSCLPLCLPCPRLLHRPWALAARHRDRLGILAAGPLLPYWLGPIVVWLTQRWSVRPDFESFDAIRHRFDADLITGFQQTRDALVSDGFARVADLVFTQRRVRTRAALFVDRAKGDLALAVELAEQVEAGTWRRDDDTQV